MFHRLYARVLKFVEAVGDAPEVHEPGPAQRLDQREDRAQRPILGVVAEGERRPQTAPTRSTVPRRAFHLRRTRRTAAGSPTLGSAVIGRRTPA
jgi:hypothetical protein